MLHPKNLTSATVGSSYKRENDTICKISKKCKYENDLSTNIYLPDTKKCETTKTSYLPNIIPREISSIRKSDCNFNEIKKTIPIKKYNNTLLSQPSTSSKNFSLINQLSCNQNSLYNHQRVKVKHTVKTKIGAKPPDIKCGDIKQKSYNLSFMKQSNEKCSCGNNDNLYTLKCKHLICRSCMLKDNSKEKSCLICQTLSKSNEINKFCFSSVFT